MEECFVVWKKDYYCVVSMWKKDQYFSVCVCVSKIRISLCRKGVFKKEECFVCVDFVVLCVKNEKYSERAKKKKKVVKLH